MKPTVYVVQDNGKNFTNAMEFGDIKVLSSRDVPMVGDPSRVLMTIKDRLKDYDPDKDYLLCTGDPLLIGAAIHNVAIKYGVVRCLKWDRMNFVYRFIELPLN